jgi:hypothetical protein
MEQTFRIHRIYTEGVHTQYHFIINNTIQIQMTQMHAYALITYEDGSIHHSSNYNNIL